MDYIKIHGLCVSFCIASRTSSSVCRTFCYSLIRVVVVFILFRLFSYPPIKIRSFGRGPMDRTKPIILAMDRRHVRPFPALLRVFVAVAAAAGGGKLSTRRENACVIIGVRVAASPAAAATTATACILLLFLEAASGNFFWTLCEKRCIVAVRGPRGQEGDLAGHCGRHEWEPCALDNRNGCDRRRFF